MSRVTDVVVFASASFDGDAFLAAVNAGYAAATGIPSNGYILAGVEYGHNGKHMESHVYAGALNHAFMEDLGRALRFAYESADPLDRGYVQIAWRTEEQEGFTLVTLVTSDEKHATSERSQLLTGWRNP